MTLDLYPHQSAAVELILDSLQRVDVVVLDAPTGSGKTFIAEAVRQQFDTRGLYICSSKGLQDQFCKDFPYARVLKGRANYPTELYPKSSDCSDCSWDQSTGCPLCSSRSSCPYQVAKDAALKSDVAVLNTTYWLLESNGPSKFSGVPFTVIDECDLLEGELLDYVGLKISRRTAEEFKLGAPKRVTKEESWEEWLRESNRVLRRARERLGQRSFDEGDDVRANRERVRLERLISATQRVAEGVGSGRWIYQDISGDHCFKPVDVRDYGDLIWNHSKKWLLMSGSVISGTQMMSELGCAKSFETVTVPSTFDISNRPIRVQPVANMARKYRTEKSDGDVARRIVKIWAAEGQRRTLVHTVSLELASTLRRLVEQEMAGASSDKQELFVYVSSADRERTVAEWQNSESGILFAQSLGRGYDFAGDTCEVQIIAKCPYPSLGDKQVSARVYGGGIHGQQWYTVNTIRSVVQAAGRIVRTPRDIGTTYILDTGFIQLYGRNKGLFPEHFREALQWR